MSCRGLFIIPHVFDLVVIHCCTQKLTTSPYVFTVERVIFCHTYTWLSVCCTRQVTVIRRRLIGSGYTITARCYVLPTPLPGAAVCRPAFSTRVPKSRTSNTRLVTHWCVCVCALLSSVLQPGLLNVGVSFSLEWMTGRTSGL